MTEVYLQYRSLFRPLFEQMPGFGSKDGNNAVRKRDTRVVNR